MKTTRTVQFLHVRDTMKAVKQDLLQLPFAQVRDLVHHRLGDAEVPSPERYAAMVLSFARGNTTWDD